MKNLKYILLMGILACDPIEDRVELGPRMTEADLNISVTQEAGHDNVVYLQNNTPEVLPFWDFGSGVSNKHVDTINIPFAGDYEIEFTAYANSGPVATRRSITVSGNDEEFFADPRWQLLTNGVDGKEWTISAVYVGPESDYLTNWWQPDISGDDYYGDIATFDLNGGYNFEKLHDGAVETGIYEFNLEDGIISLLGGVTMPVQDWGNDGIAAPNYRIFKLTADTLILGQGASFIPERSSEDWAWFSLYTRVN